MKKLILIILYSIFFGACKKDKMSTNMLKGQIIVCYSPINQIPYASSKIELYQQKNGTNINSQTLATTTTDVNGNFIFEYSTDNPNDNLTIRESSGFGISNIMTGIPLKNIDNLKIYYNGRYNLVVNLNVTKPYTNSDTLYISNPKTLNYVKKAGPFINGRYFVESGVSVKPDPNYGFNSENIRYVINNDNNSFNKDYQVETNKLCGDTVYVSLDIK